MDNTTSHIHFCLHNLEVIRRRTVKGTAWQREQEFWEAQLAADRRRLASS